MDEVIRNLYLLEYKYILLGIKTLAKYEERGGYIASINIKACKFIDKYRTFEVEE